MLFHAHAVSVVTRLLFAVVICACLGAGGRAFAQEPTLQQMDHKSWTARDGAPQGVTALAQAPDGVLWIGAEGGLFSFDGRTFSRFQPQPGEQDLPAGPVESVLATRDGAIWVGFRYVGSARIWQGRVTHYTQVDHKELFNVQHIVQSSDGTLWALHAQQYLIRLGPDGAWHKQPTPLGDRGGRIIDIFIDSSDTLWLAQGGRIFRRPLNQPRYLPTEAKADWVFDFVEMPDHSLWVNDTVNVVPGGTVGRTQHVDRYGKVLARLAYSANLSRLIAAPDGALIMAPTDEGILRISARALTDRAQFGKELRDGIYQQNNGLSSDAVETLLLDADGSLWTGGERGLDQFKKARLIPFVTKYSQGDRPFLCASSNGVVWIRKNDSSGMSLYKNSGNSTILISLDDQPLSMSCGSDGDVWVISADSRIFNVHRDRVTPIASIPGVGPVGIDQLVATPDHTLFATVEATPDVNGIWRYARGTWTKLKGMSPASIEYLDSQGRLWTGYGDGWIGLPLEGVGRWMSTGKPGLGAVFAILETSRGLFASGLNGLAVWRGDHFEMLDFADPGVAHGVGGIVESVDGDLWLNASGGVVRIPSAELRKALVESHYAMRPELIREGDFVGPVELQGGRSTTARDADGRLWFATMNGVFHIDPALMGSGAHFPVLSIRSIAADQKPVTDTPLNPGIQSLEIQYLGVNLTAPESVVYRYRLDGLDKSWQDAGHRTVAIYSHLPPGAYTFRVMASNDGDTWTAPVSSEPFRVLPHFYQTLWFMALCAILVLALAWFWFTLRLRFLSREIQARSEERADERIRIARDLHDTLLQGIQGLLLTVHVAAQKVARGEDSTRLLDNALSTADRIIIEGRDRVNSLRSEQLSDAELVGAFEAFGSDFNRDDKIEFRVQRKGVGAVLHAHVADEVFFIAREALTNSFRHAVASEIAVELNYGRRYFSLSCTDNGRGFSTDDADKSGHWGLKGMDERARKLGGHLRLRSDPASGTQVLFVLASYRAYKRHSRLKFLLRALHPDEQAPSLFH